MAVNKVVYNTENGPETLIDLTSDTVTPETLAEGVSAHDASGVIITGTMPTTNVLYTAQSLTEAQKTQARENIGAIDESTLVEELAKKGQIVPDFITAEVERVAKNVQATRTAKSLVFPIMSDFHLYYGNDNDVHNASLLSAQCAGMGISELKKRIHLDFTGYLGDYTWGAGTYTVEQVMKDITAVKENIGTIDTEIWCVGNHDLNYGANRDRLLTLDEMYSYIGANSEGVKPYDNIERGYGYLDFENQKIRVIYLNTCDTSELVVTEGQSAPAGWISPTQIQWLADTALDFSTKTIPSEWGIVIMSHHPLHDGASDADNTMKILESYRDGLSGEISCTIRTETADDGTKTYPQQKVTYDFADKERAEIICNIHGHNHNCGVSQISSTTRTGSTAVEPWLWRFCIPQICASRYNTGLENAGTSEIKQQNYGEFDENGNPVYWYKETGTAKVTSFCVVNIDRKNKKIYAHIFGAGKDRVIDYGVIKPAYTNLLIEAGYTENKKISSSGGGLTSATGYNSTGFIPIGYGSNTTARGEQVIYLANIEGLPTDSNFRLAFYDANKDFIVLQTASGWKHIDNDDGLASNIYTVKSDGYVNSIDCTGYTAYLAEAPDISKTPAFIRICAPGIDADSIITVNEPIV